MHESADIFRWFVLAEGALLVGFSVAVMVEARKFRMPPKHVWSIAVSYMILIVALSIEVHERLGRPTTWRTWTVLAAFSFGVYSQWLMLRAYQYASRLRRHERKTVEAGNAIMQKVFQRQHPEDEPPTDAVDRRHE